eukprot:128423_1
MAFRNATNSLSSISCKIWETIHPGIYRFARVQNTQEPGTQSIYYRNSVLFSLLGSSYLAHECYEHWRESAQFEEENNILIEEDSVIIADIDSKPASSRFKTSQPEPIKLKIDKNDENSNNQPKPSYSRAQQNDQLKPSYMNYSHSSFLTEPSLEIRQTESSLFNVHNNAVGTTSADNNCQGQLAGNDYLNSAAVLSFATAAGLAFGVALRTDSPPKQVYSRNAEDPQDIQRRYALNEKQFRQYNHVIQKPLIILVTIGDYKHRASILGHQRDADLMRDLWLKTFNYNEQNVMQYQQKQCTLPDLQKFIKICSDEYATNNDQYDSLIAIISCHGDEDGLILSDEGKYSMESLYEAFPCVVGRNKAKPRLFIVDKCRNDDAMKFPNITSFSESLLGDYDVKEDIFDIRVGKNNNHLHGLYSGNEKYRSFRADSRKKFNLDDTNEDNKNYKSYNVVDEERLTIYGATNKQKTIDDPRGGLLIRAFCDVLSLPEANQFEFSYLYYAITEYVKSKSGAFQVVNCDSTLSKPLYIFPA